MQEMTTWLFHFHLLVFLLARLWMVHLVFWIFWLLMFIWLKFLSLHLWLHGHHGFGSIARVHLWRRHNIVRVVHWSAGRRWTHWAWVVELRWMDVGQRRVLLRVHVGHHVVHWGRQVHVWIIERLLHGRRRCLLEVPLRRSRFFLGDSRCWRFSFFNFFLSFFTLSIRLFLFLRLCLNLLLMYLFLLFLRRVVIILLQHSLKDDFSTGLILILIAKKCNLLSDGGSGFHCIGRVGGSWIFIRQFSFLKFLLLACGFHRILLIWNVRSE